MVLGMPDHTIEDIYILSGILKGRFFLQVSPPDNGYLGRMGGHNQETYQAGKDEKKNQICRP